MLKYFVKKNWIKMKIPGERVVDTFESFLKIVDFLLLVSTTELLGV